MPVVIHASKIQPGLSLLGDSSNKAVKLKREGFQ
jgi:hypothetical protein